MIIPLLTILFFGVGCGKGEEVAGNDEVVNEESETEEAPGVITDIDSAELEGDETETDKPASVKYFEPGRWWEDSPPPTEIAKEDIEGRRYMMATYDEDGNLLSWSNYDENGEKCFGPDEWNSMIHSYEYTYNDNGKRISETTIGIDGEPVASYLPPGKYREETVYDKEGNAVCDRWLYLNGKIREFTTDEEGNLDERWYKPGE